MFMTTTAHAQNWDKSFPKSDKVNHEKVFYKNRYGITLVADLYTPKDQGSKRWAAIAVGGPFGAVKEQSSGLYAQTMAERGFVALAFDPSYTGESGGEPRYVASPDINTEDFSAAVDYLTSRQEVDPDRIGIIGICGWGGIALNAAAIDTRIKATVTSTMYDMSRVVARGYNDSMDEEGRYALRQQLNAQRTEDFKNGTYLRAGGVVDPLPADAPQFIKDYYDYYKTPRGFHPRSLNSTEGWNATSSLSLLNAPMLAYSSEIRSAVLMIHGAKAHSRYFSQDAFKELKGTNKELLIIDNASHVDLYDNQAGAIPFDKLEVFFAQHLTGLGEAATEHFTGQAWVRFLPTDPTSDYTTYVVTFAPAARNDWHIHSAGQVLFCTQGVGYYQERGQVARRLTAGDVVYIPAQVEHWHGASPDGTFVHTGLTPVASRNQVQWLGAVTDQEYTQATK